MGIRPHPSERSRHLGRVRSICSSLPATSEKLAHGEPTFFVDEKAFTIFANNHHHDGHIAVWLPAEPGARQSLIRSSTVKYFKPPYLGVRGWIGIELSKVDDAELALRIRNAWHLIAPNRRQTAALRAHTI